MKKSKELKPKYTGSLQKRTIRTVDSLQKVTTKKAEPTNVASKGLNNPSMPAKGMVKNSNTPAEVRMMSNMIQRGDVPDSREMELMNSAFPGQFTAKEYTNLAKERVENNFIPTRAPKYLAKQAKKIAVKMRKAK